MFEENATTYNGEPIVRLRRQEKAKHLMPKETNDKMTLDDLRELYFSEGTNVYQRPELPVIHHAPCNDTVSRG